MMKMQEQPSVAVKTGLPFFDVQCSELVQTVDLLDLSPLHSIASDVFVSRFHVLLDAIENFFRYEEALLDRDLIPGEIRQRHLADHEKIRRMLGGIRKDSMRKKNQTAIDAYRAIRHEIEQHVLRFSFDVSGFLPSLSH